MQRQEVKAVLFDLDGVLVDSYEAWFCVINDVLKHYKINILTRREFFKRFGFPIERDMKELFPGKEQEEVVNYYISCYKKRTGLVKINPSAAKILKALRERKIKTGLVSNSSRKIVRSVLRRFKLGKYFDIVITMDDVRHRKPHPESVLKACKKLKVSPGNTVFVGDTKNDMLAGKRAGCTTVGYKIKGRYKISRLETLIKFLE